MGTSPFPATRPSPLRLTATALGHELQPLASLSAQDASSDR